MLETVDVGKQDLDLYERSAGAEAVAQLRGLAAPLDGARILHVNATPYGGGVAEILRSEIPLLRDLGMFPILVMMYVWLARREEREVQEAFGEEYARYARHYPCVLPTPGLRKAEQGMRCKQRDEINGWAWGLTMTPGLLSMFAFWGAIIVGIVLLARRPAGKDASSNDAQDPALEDLRRRYAAGEVSHEEYDRMLEALERSSRDERY
jgi:uncharacterized membrane protein